MKYIPLYFCVGYYFDIQTSNKILQRAKVTNE